MCDLVKKICVLCNRYLACVPKLDAASLSMTRSPFLNQQDYKIIRFQLQWFIKLASVHGLHCRMLLQLACYLLQAAVDERDQHLGEFQQELTSIQQSLNEARR